MDADNGWIGALEADLRAMAHADIDLDRDAEVAERIRIERAGVGLLDRVNATSGPVEVHVSSGRRLRGVVRDGAQEWLVIETANSPITHSLVLGQAIVWVAGLRPGTRQSGVLRTRSVASICRQWARDRAEIQAELRGGSMITGRMSAAYSDHVDVVSIFAEPYAISYAALEVLTRTFD
jgi:hypothetical protein